MHLPLYYGKQLNVITFIVTVIIGVLTIVIEKPFIESQEDSLRLMELEVVPTWLSMLVRCCKQKTAAE